MSKFKYSFYIFLAFLTGIAIYSSVLFLLVENKNDIFYMSYGFSLLAFIFLSVSLHYVLIKPRSLDESFLNEPYVAVSLLYFVVQIVFGIWSILSYGVSIKLILSIDILLLGIYTICMLFLVISISMNKSIEKDTKEKKAFMSELKNRLLTISFEDKEISNAFSKLLEDIKFSEPISENKAIKQEAEINALAEELISNSSDDKKIREQIKLIRKLIKERNMLLKK